MTALLPSLPPVRSVECRARSVPPALHASTLKDRACCGGICYYS